jgi:DnaJ family protein B protein 12
MNFWLLESWKHYHKIHTIIFAELLLQVTVLLKQNQKSESAEPTVRKRQNTTKEGTHSHNSSEYTKEQLEHVKR